LTASRLPTDFRETDAAATASKFFDGDPPFAPRGCIAQAWTVGELIRAWALVTSSAATSSPSILDKEAMPFA
jgi:glycogen debranching enzyme